MAQADLYIPFNVQRQIDTFNLIRGIENTYDASIHFPDGTTFFRLVSSATGISIDQNTGVITANWGHAYGPGTTSATFRVSDTIGTGGMEVDIPVTVRDWFPADFQALHEFVSMKRSHNGESGVNLFDYQLRQGLLPNNTFTGGTVQSGSDGYADRSVFNNIQNGVMIEVTALYDQVSGNRLEKEDDITVLHGIVGYRPGQGNINYFETPGNHLRLLSNWDLADYFSGSPTAYIVNGTEYDGATADFDNNFAMGFELRRRGASNSDAVFRGGDGNNYPGCTASSATSYKFGTKVRPSNVTIGTDEAREWLLWTGYRMRNPDDASQYRVRHGIYGLEDEDTERNQNTTTTPHGGDSDMRVELDNYDFSEFFVYAFADTQSETIWQEGGRVDYVNNAVVITGNQTHQYGANT